MRQQPAQTVGATTEQAGGTLDATLRPRYALDTFGDALDAEDMQRLFGLSRTTFYRRLRAGVFHQFECLPRTGDLLWSRALLRKYFDGELRPGSAFTRRRA